MPAPLIFVRKHPARTAVNELIRPHVMTVSVTSSISYSVRAPCLLAQLRECAAVGDERGARGARPGSRMPVNVDVLDVWVDVSTCTRSWALEWNATLPAGALGVELRDPRPDNSIPWEGRLLRSVVERLDGPDRRVEVLDAIALKSVRWAESITAILGGPSDIRAVRGAVCPICKAGHTIELTYEGDIAVRTKRSAILLVDQGGARHVECRSCGWRLDIG